MYYCVVVWTFISILSLVRYILQFFWYLFKFIKEKLPKKNRYKYDTKFNKMKRTLLTAVILTITIGQNTIPEKKHFVIYERFEWSLT